MNDSSRIKRYFRRDPIEAQLAIFAIAVSAFVICYPFCVTRYAPMTDLPFHAANSGVIHHYYDPAYHLREQFDLSPLAVPYMSSYVVAALAMFVMPSWVAVKLSAAVMLALLPLGVATMFAGMKKSPLLGIAVLPFVWSFLTHWGFLNFVGAVGLFCMSIGLTLMVLDKPTTRKQLLLSAVLVLLFFTHVFRFPFAILGVIGCAIVMYPATRRFWPILPPLVPPLFFFALFLHSRPNTLDAPVYFGELATWRWPKFFAYLSLEGFDDDHETRAIELCHFVMRWTAVALVAVFVLDGRIRRQTKREFFWNAGVVATALGCTTAFLLLFFLLPMELGQWWLVYPREAITTAIVALGLLPDLPRTTILRVPLVIALGLAPIGIIRSIATNYKEFDRVTQDFHQISRSIPIAPKLMYLILDHSGTKKRNSPFVHLPAYVQAEKGGWLSFHFSKFGASPLMYRDRTAKGVVVPPPVPTKDWEWAPNKFQVLKHGPFFDWFLVRSPDSPARIFLSDPSITPVEHVGTWWLYRRVEPTKSP